MQSNVEGEIKHIFTWKIENFRLCTQKSGECLESPVFVIESLAETKWSVQLYPKAITKAEDEFISCYLKRSDSCAGPDVVECDYTIEAIDGNNKSLRKYQYVSKFKKGSSIGWKEYLERDLILHSNTSSSNDTLTIKATLKKRLPKNFSQNICTTNVATNHFSFKWSVKNSIPFSAQVKTFSFSEDLQFEITIEILDDDDVEISFRRLKGFTASQKLMCCVTLLDLNGKETNSKEAIFDTDDPDDIDTWEFPNFLKKSDIAEEKYFTLKFDFALSDGKTLESLKDIESEFHKCSLTIKEDFSDSLKTDLKCLLTNHVHADVELHVDEKVFHAHKVILCARSPVFMAMFNQDMVEKQTGAINISDVEAKTLRSLLEFMYTGDTEMLNCESALKLLLAADKYQVLSLKEKCNFFLESCVSDKNVCLILYTADLIQQESLKVCAVNHIKRNSKKIFKSDGWKHMADINLKLATDIFCEVSIV